MFEDPFFYETVWGQLVANALGSLPLLLVKLTGLIVAAVLFNRHRAVSILVMCALTISLVVLLVGPIVHQRVMERVFIGDGDPRVLRWAPLILSLSLSLLVAACWTMMIVAAFRGRSGTGTAMTGSPPRVHAVAGTGPTTGHQQLLGKGALWGAVICQVLGVLLAIPGLILTLTAGRRDEEQVIIGAVISCAACIPAVIGAVLLMIVIYRIWKGIQGEHARTTPGLAVGLLFVPLFNLYWVFQVYWGWAVDFNKLAAASGLNLPRAPQGMAMTICILFLVSVLPFVGLLVSPVLLVMVPMYLSGAIDRINALAVTMPTVTPTTPESPLVAG